MNPSMFRPRKQGLLTVLTTACAATCALTPALTHAQTLGEEAVESQGLTGKTAPGQWDVVLGAALADVPRYPGADGSRIRLRPLFSISYGEFFLSPFGLGWNVIDVGGFRAGPLIGYEEGRPESVDPRLDGLGDISASITGGGFAAYRVGSLEMIVTVRQALTNTASGLNGLAVLEEHIPLIPRRLLLAYGPEVGFGNSEHEQTFFGISPQQSLQSGISIYTPRGGLQDAGVRASLTYITESHWLIRGFGQVSRLTGDAADSPIVERRTQTLVGVGAAYQF